MASKTRGVGPGMEPIPLESVSVDMRGLLKKYMDRVARLEGVYFIYDDLPHANGVDEPFTRQELAVLHELMDELASGE